MEYPIPGKQIATAVGVIIGIVVATFLVKLYHHRRAMMGLVSNTSLSLSLSLCIDTCIRSLGCYINLSLSTSLLIFIHLHLLIFLLIFIPQFLYSSSSLNIHTQPFHSLNFSSLYLIYLTIDFPISNVREAFHCCPGPPYSFLPSSSSLLTTSFVPDLFINLDSVQYKLPFSPISFISYLTHLTASTHL